MDAFELLLRASDPDMSLNNDTKDFEQMIKGKPMFDYRDHLKNTMLDPIDSIMMLADQACQKSPIRRPGGARPLSPDTTKEENEDDNYGDSSTGMGTLLQYGSYFNMGSPVGGTSNRRSRAMSEPWLRQDAWSEELQFNRTMGTALAGNAGTSTILLNNHSTKNGNHFPAFNFGSNKDSSVQRNGLYNAESELNHRLGYSSLESSLPQMLDQYSSIYNKNGRIGIYTREERSAIIQRFREKRKRRVWKKKIRYFCRKNLADRRVRVKGRFVKSAAGSKLPPSGASSASIGSDSSPASSTSKSASAASSAASAAASLLANISNGGGRGSRGGVLRGGHSSAQSNARSALSAPDSDGDAESMDGEEGEGYSDDDVEDSYDASESHSNDMDVVGSSAAPHIAESAATLAGLASAAGEKKPARRFKLVLTASTPTEAASTAHAANGATVKQEGHHAVSGVDLLASLAARTAEEDDDLDEQDEHDEDVFTSEMLRLPSHKRTRRHSIAY